MIWIDLGSVDALSARALTAARIGTTKVLVSHVDGQFGVLSGTCNHAGGPLAEGRLEGEYVVCPWHNWKYHCRTGLGEPGFEADAVPRYDCKVENGRVFASERPVTKRTHGVHPPHPLARKIERGHLVVASCRVPLRIESDGREPGAHPAHGLVGRAPVQRQGLTRGAKREVGDCQLHARAAPCVGRQRRGICQPFQVGVAVVVTRKHVRNAERRDELGRVVQLQPRVGERASGFGCNRLP